MADIWLDSVEERLDKLEALVYDNEEKDAAYPKVIDTMANATTQINNIIASKEKIKNLFAKLPQLEKCLDPVYMDKLTLSKQAKTEIILAEEDLIRQQAENLERVEKMLNILNSEHIKVVPSLQGKLQDLCKIHIENQDKASELTEQTKDLLMHYNNAVNLLTMQFVQWDELLTKLEASKQVKKPLD